MSWEPPADDGGSRVTGYRLQIRAEGSTDDWLGIGWVGNSTSYAWSSMFLNASRVYEVRVTSVNANGHGGYAIASSKPAAVVGRFESVSMRPVDDTIVVSWHPWSSVASVRLEYRRRPDGEWQTVDFAGGPGSHTITGLRTAGYEVKLTPYSAGGVAGTSTSNTFTIVGIPDPPQNIRYVTHGDDYLSIVWDAPDGESVRHYEVRYGPSDSAVSQHTVELRDRAHTQLTGLAAGTAYAVSVRTVSNDQDSQGEHLRSDWADYTGVSTPGVPREPEDLEAVIPNTSSLSRSTSGLLDVTWTASTTLDTEYRPTRYVIGWQSDNQSEEATDTVSGTSHTLRGLENDVQYTIRVWARNQHGTSFPSTSITATPRDLTLGERLRNWSENNVVKPGIASGFRWMGEAFYDPGLEWKVENLSGKSGTLSSIPGYRNNIPYVDPQTITIDPEYLTRKGTIVHELAHAYLKNTNDYYLDQFSDEPFYRGWMLLHLANYLREKGVLGNSDCKINELAAEALENAAGYSDWQTWYDGLSGAEEFYYSLGLYQYNGGDYWDKCDGIPRNPPDGVMETFRYGGAHMRPPFVYETYGNGGRTSLDLKAIWADIKEMPGLYSPEGYNTVIVLWAFGNHFGGYCDVAKTYAALTPSPGSASAITNPWNSDGRMCKPTRPEDVEVAAGDGKLTVTWSPPDHPGGAPLDAYRVRWKRSTDAEYSGKKFVEVDPSQGQFVFNSSAVDLGDAVSAHLVNGVEYTISVEARNQSYGHGPAAEVAVVPTAETDDTDDTDDTDTDDTDTDDTDDTDTDDTDTDTDDTDTDDTPQVGGL